MADKYANTVSKRPEIEERALNYAAAKEFQELLAADRVACNRLEAAIEVMEIMQALPGQINSDEELLNLLHDRHSYLDLVKFSEGSDISRVTLSERPTGKDLLQDVPADFINQLKDIRTVGGAENLLQKELEQYEHSLELYEYKAQVDAEMRRITRIEFDGGVRLPDENKLSPLYAAVKAGDLYEEERLGKDDYDLSKSETWQKFKKFESFRRQEDDVRSALAFSEVPQQVLEQMNVADFEDVIFKYHDECTGKAGVSFVRLFEGSRAFKVKNFISNHREEFEGQLRELNVNKEVIDNTVEKMFKKGVIPPIELADGWVMKAEVHHEWAIFDSGLLNDVTEVNNADHLQLIFQMSKQKERKEEAERKAEKPLEVLLKENSLELVEVPDMLSLANDEVARQEYLKKVAREQLEPLFMAMRKVGVETDIIKESILSMANDGKIKPVKMTEGKILELQIVSRDNKARLEFKEVDTTEYNADVHKGIRHGNSTRPVYAEENPLNRETVVRAVENDNGGEVGSGKEAFAVEVKREKDEGKPPRFIRRIMSKGRETVENGVSFMAHAECYFGTMKAVIYSNLGDAQGQKNRFNRLERAKSIDRFYGVGKSYGK